MTKTYVMWEFLGPFLCLVRLWLADPREFKMLCYYPKGLRPTPNVYVPQAGIAHGYKICTSNLIDIHIHLITPLLYLGYLVIKGVDANILLSVQCVPPQTGAKIATDVNLPREAREVLEFNQI